MKKLILTTFVTVLLSISALPLAIQANDGDGHDAGYQCSGGTTNCPPPAVKQSGTTSSTSLVILQYILSILPKG